MADSHVIPSATSLTAFTDKKEASKREKHGPACEAADHDFWVAAGTTFGGLGDEILDKLRILTASARTQEITAGGTGRIADGMLRYWILKASFSIQASTANMALTLSRSPEAAAPPKPTDDATLHSLDTDPDA